MSVKLLKVETFPTGKFLCNCSLIYSTETMEAIIIDPGDDEKYLLSEIEARNLKVKLLLHTHAHFDHIGCSKAIHQKYNANICLHKGDEFLYKSLPVQAMMFGLKPMMPGKVNQWLQDGEEFSLDDYELKKFLKTIHTPGHTEGSCSFYTEYFNEPILFSGDTLFNASIGRTDLPGGDFDKLKKSIKDRLYSLPEETRVITGHGSDTRIFEEKKSNPFVCA